jgi:hypothetical protein
VLLQEPLVIEACCVLVWVCACSGLQVLLQEPLVIKARGVLVRELPHRGQARLVCWIVGALAGREGKDRQVGGVVGHL